MAVRKKQDDKYLLALRELVNSGAGNRQCFDCNQKGPTYVNMTIGSFVCTRCSGVLRGLTPPHRVKSISMATFTQDELDFLKAHGNELCAKTWLGLWDPKRAAAQQQDQRELMIDKYERKRYYLEPASPLKSLNLKTSSNGYHSHNNSNNNNSSNNNNNSSNISSNGYASIHLTPPAAQRTAANGLSKTTSSSASTTAISRPQHHHHHNNHNQSQLSSSNGNGHDAFNLGLGLTSLNSAGSTSTGALSDTSSCASNGFAGDTDFVADFGTANIFDATSARSTGSPAVSSASSVSSTNGYAKVQPIRAAHLQQQQQQQQQQQHMLNGNNSENFADFDHAPIYNAGGASLQSSQLGQQQQQQQQKRSPRAGGNAPSEDRYAALKDLDEQLRELKASEATVTEAPTPTNANNNAALDAFGTAAVNHNNNNNNNANPFKSQQALHINGNGNSSPHVVNPFQAQQLQQQLQQQQNLYGQLTLIPNGYGSSPQQTTGVGGGMLQQPQASSFYNFNNNGYALNQGLPNGCGFGSMQPAPVLAGGLAGGFNNPFAASGVMNTNNPFL